MALQREGVHFHVHRLYLSEPCPKDRFETTLQFKLPVRIAGGGSWSGVW